MKLVKLFALLFVFCSLALAQQPVNVTQWDATTLGAPSAYGTAPGAVNVMGVNAYVTNNVPVTESGTWNVRVTGNAGGIFDTTAGATAAADSLEVGAVYNSSAPTPSTGQQEPLQLDSAANLLVNVKAALPTGSNTIGKVDLLGNSGVALDVAAGATAATNSVLTGGVYNSGGVSPSTGQQEPLQLDSAGRVLVNCTGCSAGSTVQLIPGTSGGVTMSHLLAAASTNGTVLKGSSGQLYGAAIYNNAAYPVYMRFYNTASAPTVGTTTIVYEVPVQAGTEREVHSDEGLAFSSGIAYSLTKGIADTDTTATAANDASMDLIYK
jgi:hypothetical protein